MRIGKVLCSKKELLWASLLSILAAAGVLLFCTKSSPLYPTNDWVDTNCFFTVGKSMFEGRVPYLDIYEQKGPLLYFLYGLCYLVSPTSFLGVTCLRRHLPPRLFLLLSDDTALHG